MRRLSALLLSMLLAGCRAGVDAVSWEPPAVAVLTAEPALERATIVAAGRLSMPEDVAVDATGVIHTGLADGRIVQVVERQEGETEVLPFATTPGVPLGLKFGPGGDLYACVSGHGVVAVDAAGTVRDVVTRIAGKPLVFANDLDVGPDGTIYFTESSTRFDAAGAGPIRAIAENRPDGRVLAHDLATGVTRVVASGLCFPNGVTVTHGGQALLVAETARYRLSRVWLAGPRAGETEALPAALPGIPDGLMSDGAGTVWVALVPREALLDSLAPHAWARNLVASLPDPMLMGIAGSNHVGMVAALDEDGVVKRLLTDTTGRFPGGIANVAPVGRHLYMGTKWGDWVAVLPRP